MMFDDGASWSWSCQRYKKDGVLGVEESPSSSSRKSTTFTITGPVHRSCSQATTPLENKKTTSLPAGQQKSAAPTLVNNPTSLLANTVST
jgi:hypothetical protein